MAIDPVARGLGARAVNSAILDRLLDKLSRCAQRASVANPRLLGVMSSPPTVTADGTTLPAGQTNAYTSITSPSVFHISGGTPVSVPAGYRIKSAQIAATGGNLGTNNGAQASAWRITALVDAAKVTFRVGPTSAAYRFLVDGQYVNMTGTTTLVSTGSTNEYISLDFGSRSMRRITIEGQQTCAFVGVYVGATEKVYAYNPTEALTGVLVGDSYAAGSTATALGDAYGMVMADWLGLAKMTTSGSSGTGWATNNGSLRFDERISGGDLALGGSPDLIFLMGSYNDRALAAATITANTRAGLVAARAAYPRVPIFVLGTFPAATGPSQGILDAESAVFSAVDALADPLTAKIPVSTASTGALITGIGKIGATTGSGNSDIYTDTDGIHPPTAGHAFIGKWAAQQVLAAAASLR